MSGQCLSASGAGRALTPARHLRLGGPSPHQPANTARAPPGAADLWSCDVIGNYPVSRRAMPDPRIGRPRTPAPSAASPPCGGFARLACLIHAANVRSEPGSNPSIFVLIYPRPRAGFNLNGSVCLVAQKRNSKSVNNLSLDVISCDLDAFRLSAITHPRCLLASNKLFSCQRSNRLRHAGTGLIGRKSVTTAQPT